ncbi:HNH endonuclease [Clostridium tagluense]|uniref:HNH endonuclease n=1 Tax=Clostridium tagluense TaxID=360422 RepID=UPI001C6EFE94|nr:HNH endonuclease [Clostridium tagluense]MBW9154871.1 HNH endonuclease [Clostridium tagluense]WLC64326.1 HNH endonuclease [Clostridium tagluense]
MNDCKNKNKKIRNKDYDKFSRNKDSASFYASKPWRKVTKSCKSKFNGIDIYEYYVNKQMVYGSLSHHIIEIVEDKSKSLDISNLIYLSDSTHALVHVEYKSCEQDKKSMQELLMGLIKRWEEEYVK